MLRIGARRLALPTDVLPTPVRMIGSVMSLALLGDSLLYVALPAHASELALPLWSVGVLLGANRIVRLVTNGLAATLFTRVGGRGPVVAAGVGSVVTTAMYGLVPTFLPLLLAPPERRAEVMSGYSDWVDIGAALGPPLAFVLADWLGLFPSYGCTAVLLIAVAGWFVGAWRRR